MHKRPHAFPRLGQYRTGALSLCEEILGFLKQNIAAHIGEISQSNAFGAYFDAVLSKAALLNAAVARQRAQPLFLQNLAGRDGC